MNLLLNHLQNSLIQNVVTVSISDSLSPLMKGTIDLLENSLRCSPKYLNNQILTSLPLLQFFPLRIAPSTEKKMIEPPLGCQANDIVPFVLQCLFPQPEVLVTGPRSLAVVQGDLLWPSGQGSAPRGRPVLPCYNIHPASRSFHSGLGMGCSPSPNHIIFCICYWNTNISRPTLRSFWKRLGFS